MATSSPVEDVTRPGPVVITPTLEALVERALMYLQQDIPLHLSGPPGVGKTTLALYLAHRLGRPVYLLHGDETLTTAELVGAPVSYTRRLVVDEFIRSVHRREESLVERWVANRLAVACRAGGTLVYDEFTRSRPEANNVLLPVLEERVLPLPTAHGELTLMAVHPEFRLILTSNPDERAGVHAVQEALLDRVVTLWLPGYRPQELARIVAARTGLAEDEACTLVEAMATAPAHPSRRRASLLRAALMAAKVITARGLRVHPHDPGIRTIIADVLGLHDEAARQRQEEAQG